MGDMQAQSDELRRQFETKLAEQAATIRTLKSLIPSPEALADLEEAARVAVVQQELDEELVQADTRTFGGVSKSLQAATHAKMLKRFKKTLTKKSENNEKRRKLDEARAYFLGDDGAPRVPAAVGEERKALAASIALAEAVDRATVAARKTSVELEIMLAGGGDADFAIDVFARVRDDDLLLEDAPRAAVVKEAIAAALIKQGTRTKV